MRTLRLTLLLVLPIALGSACGDKDDTANENPEADADTDSDADADVDTGTPACSETDLVFSAEVRDPTGAPCSTCPADEPLDFVGVVRNPCADDVILTTGSACLVADWTLTVTHTGVIILSGSRECAAVMTDWVVPAGGSIEDTVDSYATYQEIEHRLEVVFDDAASTSAAVTFDIDEI